ncbi:MAG TPA: ATP-binding protein [Burkholderiaceae bacterium]|nr:ATP-binding protein [Burkholderiaceae bacterium]
MMRVFPSGRLCSLRRVLLLWLVPVFVLVAAVSAGAAYWSYNTMVSTFMDNQMSLLADSIAAQEQNLPPQLQPQNAESVHKWGTYVVQVFDKDGRLQATSWPDLAAGLQEAPGFHDLRNGRERWRIYTTQAGDAPGQHRVQVLQSGWFRKHLVVERAGAAIAPVIILLPLLMLILWGAAAMVSRGLREIADQAARQDEHTIAELPLERVPEEIAPLVRSFNSLLTRLRDAFNTQRRFVQDAAHELRTPIAAIGLQLENLRGDIGGGASAQRFAQLESGVQRAQRLVDQLLKLSRQEAATAEPQPESVNLPALLQASIGTLIALADRRGIDLGLLPSELPDGQVQLRCHSADLRSVLDNLIENALRYTPEGGVVDVRVVKDGERFAIEVMDTGPGIPEEFLGRVFDRFFRVPGNDARGSGLGLSIAQASAQRCGLRVSLRNRTDTNGLVARVGFAS